MTPHQRLYTALSNQEPDRIPVLPKIWADYSVAQGRATFKRLAGNPALAMETIIESAVDVGADGARLFWFPPRQIMQQGAELIEVTAQGRRLGAVDTAGGLHTQITDPATIDLQNPYFTTNLSFYPTRQALVSTVEDIERMAVPTSDYFEDAGWGALQRQMVEKYGKRIALIGNCYSATLSWYSLLRGGLASALIDFYLDPQLVHAGMQKGAEIAVAKGKFHIDCGINILRLNDSAGNIGMISPGHWRQFIEPYIAYTVKRLKAYNPAVRVYCHICGNVLPILSDLAKTGLDAIGPLDPLGGFTIADARKQLGCSIALMGGLHTLSLLNASPQQVAAEAENCLAQGGRRGYILASGCSVPRATPRQNLVEMVQASKKAG